MSYGRGLVFRGQTLLDNWGGCGCGSPPYGLVLRAADRRPYILVNVSDPALPDCQKLAEDLDLELFRSVPWFRKGVTTSGVFNNQIHT